MRFLGHAITREMRADFERSGAGLEADECVIGVIKDENDTYRSCVRFFKNDICIFLKRLD